MKTRSAWLAAAALALSIPAAQAATPPVAVDAIGDFLATYTGPQAADLDVVSAVTFYDAASQVFSFTATMAGNIGTTAGATYVWGVNRGAGIPALAAVAPGVLFDSVLFVDATGSGAFVDIFSGQATPLVNALQVAGRTLNVNLSASAMAPTAFAGVDPSAYTWNLWPRSVFNPSDDSNISDFAPDNSNLGMLTVSAVPEPATWLSLALGLPLLVLRSRRQRRV